ncbi:MAG: ACP S-malonyltransferase [Candidatus Omnitrophica bacterium]|nr:ACP S-malonyltransferase [Candidatus Omnitrophota bacterium]MBU1134186.1 ACP S-malonyltransferase [Candidatus Omnitrophota bacterium]MBU1366387.1 ACP S-malonyltransferase [Candidatus Omnitrophota bacterium]MBU1523094.1 ACP S-malonyltransferase [Candidatus Omnitrophota bacterium]MBU1811258.1 ACP S-malonyltransferase [Candidatus Omnitrophota bacterium]
MKAVIFPGQGSQYVGMGKDIYDNFPQVRSIFSQVEEIAGFELSKKCFFGPEEELKDTSTQQLAILAVSLGCFEIFKQKHIKIDYFAGLSLGEYSCLNPAGVLSLENLVTLVKARGLAMQEASLASSSCMFAVIGLEERVLREGQASGFYIANKNCPGQIVISLSQENRFKIKEALINLGARVVELEVSGGFHSPFMEAAKARLEKAVNDMDFFDANIPIVSNVTARAHQNKEEIKKNLIEQLTSTVLWRDCVEFMAAKGVEAFFEVGPSKVLRGLIRKINPQIEVINIEKKEDL